MTSSATSTDRRPPDQRATFQPWHFFILLSMAAATVAVMVSRDTHPAALLLLSAAVIGAGCVAIGVTYTVSGFFKRLPEAPPLAPQARVELEREKALVLRSIKELEFDRAMKKISDEDFSAISARLRARALALMQDLERLPSTPEPARPQPKSVAAVCASCGTRNDVDARFCKSCGTALQEESQR